MHKPAPNSSETKHAQHSTVLAGKSLHTLKTVGHWRSVSRYFRHLLAGDWLPRFNLVGLYLQQTCENAHVSIYSAAPKKVRHLFGLEAFLLALFELSSSDLVPKRVQQRGPNKPCLGTAEDLDPSHIDLDVAFRRPTNTCDLFSFWCSFYHQSNPKSGAKDFSSWFISWWLMATDSKVWVQRISRSLKPTASFLPYPPAMLPTAQCGALIQSPWTQKNIPNRAGKIETSGWHLGETLWNNIFCYRSGMKTIHINTSSRANFQDHDRNQKILCIQHANHTNPGTRFWSFLRLEAAEP